MPFQYSVIRWGPEGGIDPVKYRQPLFGLIKAAFVDKLIDESQDRVLMIRFLPQELLIITDEGSVIGLAPIMAAAVYGLRQQGIGFY